MNPQDYQRYLRRFLFWIGMSTAGAIITIVITATGYFGNMVIEIGNKVENHEVKIQSQEEKFGRIERDIENLEKSNVAVDTVSLAKIANQFLITMDSFRELQREFIRLRESEKNRRPKNER